MNKIQGSILHCKSRCHSIEKVRSQKGKEQICELDIRDQKQTENRGSKLCTDTSTLSDSDQGERGLILKVSEANVE